MSKLRLLVIAFAIFVSGLVLGYVPMLVQDLVFLHQARLQTETAQRLQAAQAAASKPAPVQDSGHVEPAPAAPPKK